MWLALLTPRTFPDFRKNAWKVWRVCQLPWLTQQRANKAIWNLQQDPESWWKIWYDGWERTVNGTAQISFFDSNWHDYFRTSYPLTNEKAEQNLSKYVGDS